MTIAIDTKGLHPTTVSCLDALQWLAQHQHPIKNALDMGCGDGLLSMAATGMFGAHVLAADISEDAVAHATQAIAAQGYADRITAVRSDGFAHSLISQRAPYDLIIFNLLAEPIVQMAPQVVAHLAQGGLCILSGILTWLAPQVETTYTQLGFHSLHTISRNPWQTYILQHRPLILSL